MVTFLEDNATLRFTTTSEHRTLTKAILVDMSGRRMNAIAICVRVPSTASIVQWAVIRFSFDVHAHAIPTHTAAAALFILSDEYKHRLCLLSYHISYDIYIYALRSWWAVYFKSFSICYGYLARKKRRETIAARCRCYHLSTVPVRGHRQRYSVAVTIHTRDCEWWAAACRHQNDRRRARSK